MEYIFVKNSKNSVMRKYEF